MTGSPTKTMTRMMALTRCGTAFCILDRSAPPEQPRQRNMNYLVPVCLTNGCVERHLPCSEPFKGIITDNKRHVFKRELIEKNPEQKKSEIMMTPLTGIAIYFLKNSIQ